MVVLRRTFGAQSLNTYLPPGTMKNRVVNLDYGEANFRMVKRTIHYSQRHYRSCCPPFLDSISMSSKIILHDICICHFGSCFPLLRVLFERNYVSNGTSLVILFVFLSSCTSKITYLTVVCVHNNPQSDLQRIFSSSRYSWKILV